MLVYRKRRDVEGGKKYHIRCRNFDTFWRVAQLEPAKCLYIPVYTHVEFQQLFYHISHRMTENTLTGPGFKQTR